MLFINKNEARKRSRDLKENGNSTNVTNRRSRVGLSTPFYTTKRAYKKQRSYFRLLFIPVLFVTPEEFLLVATGSEEWALLRQTLTSRSAFWSAESEALPQRRALWSAESEAKYHSEISNFPTFLLYLDYELLLRSLRSLRSKNNITGS